MNHKRQVIEAKEPGAPAYLVTFCALVTLLMLFFITLLSLASVQDEGVLGKSRYAESRESFFRSIRTFGLGIFSGGMEKFDFGNVKPKYFIINPDKLFEGRSIDAEEEGIRRVFKDVSRSMETMPSQIVAKTTNFSVTNISFLPGNATLNEPAKKFLTRFALDLQQGTGSKSIKLYVLGLADDQATEKDQWILSAKRAKVVADYLRGILWGPSSGSAVQAQRSAFGGWSKWSVYWWGAGPGGDWVRQDSPISKQSQILIAVLRADD